VGWIYLAQDRDKAGSCECRNKPSAAVNCGERLDWLRNYYPVVVVVVVVVVGWLLGWIMCRVSG
jgi:hypothetical protein